MFEQSIGKKTSLRDSIIEDFNKIEKLNLLKNNSLYVSIDKDSFKSPSDLISKEMVIDLIAKADLRLALAQPLFRSLPEMKAVAELLKKAMNDPVKDIELNKRASDEFGINLISD